MKTVRLDKMVKGWFVGDFEPTALRTNSVEVAVKYYKQGDTDICHYHKIATEVTVVISGEVEMNGKRFKQGDIIVVAPGESTTFKAITDSVNAVVKVPGAKEDKYLGQPDP